MFTVYTLTMYFITIPGNRQAGASNFAEFFRARRRSPGHKRSPAIWDHRGCVFVLNYLVPKIRSPASPKPGTI